MTMFDFLCQRKLECFDEQSVLYHYTSVDTLNKFLEDSGDLYCTHSQVLNDSSELKMGMVAVDKYLQEMFDWSASKAAWFRENYNRLVSGKDIVVPWIMSFSQERDSLNQWGMYTDRVKGGVAVGFRMAELWGAIDRFPGAYSKAVLRPNEEKGTSRAFELRLLPCLYAKTDAKLIHSLFDEVLLPHKASFKAIGDAASIDDINPKDFTGAIFAILEVSSIIKHEAFKHEKEIRLALMPMTKSLVDCELIGGKPRWKTYISETLKEGIGNPRRKALRGMIKEIMISPHGDTDVLWTTVSCLLEKYEMTWCSLERSALPYNAR